MTQLNLKLTPELKKDLQIYMQKKGIKKEAEAIRIAVQEVSKRSLKKKSHGNSAKDVSHRIKLKRLNPKFKPDNELWEGNSPSDTQRF